MDDLAILIPVLKRPHRAKPVLGSALAATPEARVVFICDPDDEPEIKAVEAESDRCEMLKQGGRYAVKINAAVRATEEPLLFFGADDLEFHPGWLEAATARLVGDIGVVATNDLCNGRVMAGELATHPLVTREYTKRGLIDNPEMVLNERYPHEYVDREFSETAQHRRAFAYAPEAVVEHLHPMVGKAPMDELYQGYWTRMWQGTRVYSRRCHKWGVVREARRGREEPKMKRTDGWKPQSL